MKKNELNKFRENYADWDINKDIYTEGLGLAVHFDEKEDIKQYGVKWDSDTKQWWLPSEKATGATVKELNDRKMIIGMRGKVDQDAAANAIGDEAGTDFTLRNMEGSTVSFTHYASTELVCVNDDGRLSDTIGESNIKTPDDARALWDNLVAGGYVRA